MTLFLFLVWLQMSAQPQTGLCPNDKGCLIPTEPSRPSIGILKCYQDATVHDLICLDEQGHKIDVTEWMMKAQTIPISANHNEPAEPVDVPAVQVGEQLSYDCGQGIACIDHYVPMYSCKDKSRILEHDENSPPKYWCRKVEF